MGKQAFTGPRGVGVEVTMSFMCSEAQRKQIRAAAKRQKRSISEFIRDAVEQSLEGEKERDR